MEEAELLDGKSWESGFWIVDQGFHLYASICSLEVAAVSVGICGIRRLREVRVKKRL